MSGTDLSYSKSFDDWVEAWPQAVAPDANHGNAQALEERNTLSKRIRLHHSSLGRVLARRSARKKVAHEGIDYNAMFGSHAGSAVCGVCYATEILRKQGPNAIPKRFLWSLFDRNVPQSVIGNIIKYHTHGLSFEFDEQLCQHSTLTRKMEAVKLIRRVEVVLELDGQWPVLRLQEYKRSDTLQVGSYDILRQLPDLELDPVFRHRDKLMFLPCLDRIGCARPVGRFLDTALINSWVQQCKSNHITCIQQRKAPFPVSLMLIDAEDESIVDVTPGTRPPYLALSYVWGGVPQPKLTKATREQLKVRGGLKGLSLPRTILDAIALTKLIGYRYLWVDALCIVQDDSSSRHHQIAQMYDVYQTAEVTIVAAGGSSCSEAIPGVSGDRREHQHKVHGIPGIPLMELPESDEYSVETSNWKTRGWTFQEELCSQRLLVLLPGRAVFACPSVLHREDRFLEVSPNQQHHQDSRQGLALLSVILRNLEKASRQHQIVLFQGLVKQYMHRSFSRDDDIENAFAGVSRMLEPVIGPSYHGIPEKYFFEIIQGCWLLETSLVRRGGGFPSWSWVGWKYTSQQTDAGIQAFTDEGIQAFTEQKIVLHFYRWDADIQKLGQSPPRFNSVDERRSIWRHFIPNEKKFRAWLSALQLDNNAQSKYLIAFTTSSVVLKLSGPFDFTTHGIGEYDVVHPDTGKWLTTIRLDNGFVAQTGDLYRFIVIAYEEWSDSFRLMLVSPTCEDCQVWERVNVTVQERPVQVDDWISLGPRKCTFIMA